MAAPVISHALALLTRDIQSAAGEERLPVFLLPRAPELLDLGIIGRTFASNTHVRISLSEEERL